MNKKTTALTGLAFGLVLFFAVNILGSTTLRSVRADLTEDHLYTLTDGTRKILENLDEPIHLYLYYSEGQVQGLPSVKSYGTRVREVLEEYALISDGKLVLEVIDPEPFSEEEDEAVQAGIAPLPLPGGTDTLYFGLVATNSVGEREVLPFFDPSKESFLEYDLSNLIYTLDNTVRPTVGLMTALPMTGSPPLPQQNPMAPPHGGQDPWILLDQIRRYYDVEEIDTTAEEIPESVDVLMIVHPKDLSDRTLYAIDQYVLGGGRAIVFVDPRCELDQPPQDPNDPMAAMTAKRDSSLGPLFEAWGVELDEGMVAADRSFALSVRVPGRKNRPEQVDYVVWMELKGDEAFNRDEVVTGQLQHVLVQSAGVLKPRSGATTELTPLITTSKDSMEVPASRLMMPDPKSLLAGFLPENRKLTIAARISGPVESAFPAGPPPDPLAGDDAGTDGDGDAASEHLTASSGPIQVVVAADVDFLQDDLWIQEVNFGGLSLGFNKLEDNGDFVLNTIEQLSGSDDLIGIRGRGRATRPLTRVDDIRKKADSRYLEKQQELEAKLRETEQKLAELQRSEGGSDMILTPAQQAELEKFRLERVKTRKQLRDVELEKQRDIDRLGRNLMLANTLGVPLLVIAFGIAFGAWRVKHRKD